ncbi:hypothetical protein CG477_020415 [Bacillus cytotoxicus]|nr:hypothetical protein CG479_019345 [Bacillus cytotoxicus]AWC54547.1 hypothetical protein CG477_020415 [Bacillus cytotoxicus]AWC66807.1 hypothetical protein CG475_020450 [Bacillus cytotoxicus]
MDYKNKISLKMINMLKSTSSIKVTNHSIIFIRLKGSIFILIELYPESWILKKSMIRGFCLFLHAFLFIRETMIKVRYGK